MLSITSFTSKMFGGIATTVEREPSSLIRDHFVDGVSMPVNGQYKCTVIFFITSTGRLGRPAPIFFSLSELGGGRGMILSILAGSGIEEETNTDHDYLYMSTSPTVPCTRNIKPSLTLPQTLDPVQEKNCV